MMKKLRNYIYILATVIVFYSCSPADGNHPGSEYMPDMAHSIAYEANVYTYYSLNTWEEASILGSKELSNPRLPVNGTVARGYAGVSLDGERATDEVIAELRGENAINAIAVPVNGNAPYYYGDNDDERLRATAEILDNPFPITAEGLAKGKELYDIFCGICHGENGGGLGYLVREADPAKGIEAGKYPAAPANLLLPDYANASNGRYYHAIIYGKNVMGGYADKMNYEERWQVIHYIRALQAKDLKLAYNEEVNEWNPEFGVPAASIEKPVVAELPEEVEGATEGDGHDGDDHGAEEGGHDSDGHSEEGGH